MTFESNFALDAAQIELVDDRTLAPVVDWTKVSVSRIEIVDQFVMEREAPARVAYLEVFAGDYANAQRLNGRPNLYNGPIQKQLEASLLESMGSFLDVKGIRVQVTCSTPLEDLDFGPQESKRIERLPWLGLGALDNGPPALAPYVRRYGMSELLVREGRIVGPSPALADALLEISVRLRPGARVLDPFAGSFLTEAVLRDVRPDIDVIALDRIGSDGIPTKYDAFSDAPQGPFDLVVLDPLYEDLFAYVRANVPKLRPSFLLVQSGEKYDLGWNEAANRLLSRLGDVIPLRSLTERWGKYLTFVTVTA